MSRRTVGESSGASTGLDSTLLMDERRDEMLPLGLGLRLSLSSLIEVMIGVETLTSSLTGDPFSEPGGGPDETSRSRGLPSEMVAEGFIGKLKKRGLPSPSAGIGVVGEREFSGDAVDDELLSLRTISIFLIWALLASITFIV